MISESVIESTVAKMFAQFPFPAEPSGLYDPLRYMIELGGKHIRPHLCLTTYALFRDNIDDSVLQPAAALELFHTFTLFHDDIMDRSPLRRGKPSVWAKWGEDTAILSGDVMLIEAYKHLEKAPQRVLPALLNLFSTTASEVCEGQQLDMDFESVESVSMEDYERMIGLKTAVLIACSAKFGALLAGVSQRQADALYRYGYELGMAFQIADDFLDVYGDEKTFGKPIGGDIVNAKKSWLLTCAQHKPEFASELAAAMAIPVDTPEGRSRRISAVRDIYDRAGVAQEAKAAILSFNSRALEAVQSLRLGKVRRALLQRFADRLIGRAK